MYQGTARCSSSRFLCCRLWRRFKENFPLCGALRHGVLSVSPSGCSFAVCFSCFFPTGKPPDVGYDVRGLSFFRKDFQNRNFAKLLFMKGKTPAQTGRIYERGDADGPSEKFFPGIFRKDSQNQKSAKSLFMKGKAAAIFGNDSRESFPNRLEE